MLARPQITRWQFGFERAASRLRDAPGARPRQAGNNVFELRTLEMQRHAVVGRHATGQRAAGVQPAAAVSCPSDACH